MKKPINIAIELSDLALKVHDAELAFWDAKGFYTDQGMEFCELLPDEKLEKPWLKVRVLGNRNTIWMRPNPRFF